MNDHTTAPSMEEAHAILDNLTQYQAVSDANKALGFLRDVIDGNVEGDTDTLQCRLNAASMLYQVSVQREQLALQGLQVAAQMRDSFPADQEPH